MRAIKTLTAYTSAFVISISSLLVFAVPSVHAVVDTCTWTGAGTLDNFNDATNWTGCDNGNLPQNGDNLVFPFETLSISIDNDLISSVNNVTFTGNSGAASTGTTDIYGNNITINGDVIVGEKVNALFTADTITLGASIDVTLLSEDSTIAIGGATAFNMGSNTITVTKSAPFTGTTSLGSAIFAAPIIGTSNSVISLNGVTVHFQYSSPSFDGEIQATNSYITYVTSGAVFGGTGKGIVMNNSRLSTSGSAEVTINDPITVNGNFLGASSVAAEIGTEVFYVIGSAGVELTLAGGLTLQSDILVDPYSGPLNITGNLSGAHVLGITAVYTPASKIVITSPTNTSLIPNGDYALIDTDTTVSDSLPAVDLIIERGKELILNGTRGKIIVSAQSTLKGTGTAGAVNMFDGAHFAPGLSPGCMSTGDLSFAVGSSFDVEIGGATECTGYDRVNVTGTVTLANATLTPSVWNNFDTTTLTTGQELIIINNDSNDAVSGTFNGLPQGSVVVIGSGQFTLSYVGGDGNDVSLIYGGVAPGTPNSGGMLIMNNPLIIMISTIIVSGSILVISRKYNLLKG